MANRMIPADGGDTVGKTVRASVSFPEDQYAELERIARSQRVSVAWVVRDAVGEYINSRWPLFANEAEARETER